MTDFAPSPDQAQALEEKDSPWEASSVANLVRWKASKVYFARLKVNGKLIRKSLQTKLFSVAKNRLPEIVEAERSRYEDRQRLVTGKMMCGDASKLYPSMLQTCCGGDALPHFSNSTRCFSLEPELEDVQSIQYCNRSKLNCLN
jgi:hypothetical protein